MVGKLLATGSETGALFSGAAIVLTALWIGWGLVFYLACRRGDADAAVTRAVTWLLRGSVAELLVAVPTHVIVRRRDDCCAPAATFWGIVTGLSVLLAGVWAGGLFSVCAKGGNVAQTASAVVKPSAVERT